MKMKYAAQIKEMLCSKVSWVADKDCDKCFQCHKEFKPLVRWKHHCRFCGKIFCSSCSNNILTGQCIGYSEEKRLRHCQNCHLKIANFLVDEKNEQAQSTTASLLKKGALSDFEDQYEQALMEEQQKSINIHNQNHVLFTEVNQNLEAQIKSFLEERSKSLCLKWEIEESIWSHRLAELAYKTAFEIKVQNFIRTSIYDIIKEVKIKTIETEKDLITSVSVKGFILEKNPTNKNMPTHLTNPKIMLITQPIEAESLVDKSTLKFEDIVKNQKNILKNHLEKIIKLKPNIIFAEESVSAYALEQFSRNNIVVVIKVKKKDMEIIQKLAKIKKKIEELWMIEKYQVMHIMGSCDRVYFKAIKPGQMLMFIESEVGIRSVILGDKSEEVANYLKAILQILLKMAWQLRLEKELILKETKLKQFISKKINLFFLTDFHTDIYQSYQSFLNFQELKYSKAELKIIRYQEANKIYQEYGVKMGKQIFLEYCTGISYEKKKIYSSEDISIGLYILYLVAKLSQKCKRCQHSHVDRYYFAQYCINITIESLIKRKSSFAPIKMNLDLDDDEEAGEIQSQKDLIYNTVCTHFKSINQKAIIKLFLACDNCNQNLEMQKLLLGKQFLSNSLCHYLFKICNSKIEFDKNSSPEKKKRKESFQKCEHTNFSRIFQCGGAVIKFNIFKQEKYSINFINLCSQQSQKLYHYNELKKIKIMKKNQIQEKKLCLELIEIEMQKIPFFTANPNSSLILSNLSPKAMANYENFNNLSDIIKKLTEFIQIMENSVEEEQKDWTMFMCNMHKIEIVLKQSIQIMNHINNSVKKEKFQEIRSAVEDYGEYQIEGMELDKETKSTSSKSFDQSENQMSMARRNATSNIKGRKETSLIDTDNDIDNFLKKLRAQRFPRHQGNIMYYHIAYVNDPVSILACALNSEEFRQSVSEDKQKDQINLKMQYGRQMKMDWQLKVEVDKIHKQIFREESDKSETYEISIFYHKEFEELRKQQGIDFDLFVRSLCGCQSWDSSGGKSNSTFSKSHNQVIVVKIINEKQFVQFQKFAPQYLKYMRHKRQKKQESLLAKIYGIYEANIRNKVSKFIVMQNIFFGMNGNLKVYDLKGSEVNRLAIPQNEKNMTGLDTNFSIDKDCNPYLLEEILHERIIKNLEEDARFLQAQSVIDYSLLVIESDRTLRLGIIDFMRPYHLIEKLETFYKEIKSGKDPTVIPPQAYADRFFNAMKRYFSKIEVN